MREILFRGKTKITNDWVFGDLFQHGEQRFIMADNRNTEVIPETVGQFTGLTDENGTKIFEGDIVWYDYENERGTIKWDNGTARFITSFATFVLDFDSVYGDDLEVIGNIYDNPERLEEE